MFFFKIPFSETSYFESRSIKKVVTIASGLCFGMSQSLLRYDFPVISDFNRLFSSQGGM